MLIPRLDNMQLGTANNVFPNYAFACAGGCSDCADAAASYACACGSNSSAAAAPRARAPDLPDAAGSAAGAGAAAVAEAGRQRVGHRPPVLEFKPGHRLFVEHERSSAAPVRSGRSLGRSIR